MGHVRFSCYVPPSFLRTVREELDKRNKLREASLPDDPKITLGDLVQEAFSSRSRITR